MTQPQKTSKASTRTPLWRQDRPYNDLPKLPPGVDLESKAVLKACLPARVALAELKKAAELLPNQAVLIGTLPLLESQASSEIENIVTTADKLFRHQRESEHAEPATKEALRHSQALLEGFRSLTERPLTTSTAEEVCSKIKGVEMRVRRVSGTALADNTGEIVYTPPEGESLLRDLLADWERYMHNHREVDPLVRMAVGHYQFEAIHPFTDGNGRTGRVINSLFLVHEDLLALPILYLSRYIIRSKKDYYRLLLEVTRDDVWEEWVLFMIRGVEETAIWTLQKIEAIRDLLDRATNYVREKRPKIYSYELLNLIFELPYCRISNVVEAGLAKRQTASRYLKDLTEIGLLEELTVGREKLFLNRRMLTLLTEDTNAFEPFE